MSGEGKVDTSFRNDVLVALVIIFILTLVAFVTVLTFNLKNNTEIAKLQNLVQELDQEVNSQR